MNIKQAQQIILEKLKGKDLQETAVAFYEKQGKKINPKDKGVIGRFVEEFCFGKKHDSKQGRDLNCAELKTKKIKMGKRGYCFDSLTITQAKRDQIVNSSYKNHPVFDKCSDMIIVYHYEYKLVKVGVFQPTKEQHLSAKKDYDLIKERARSHNSEEGFILSSFAKICQHGFFQVRTKSFGQTKGRTFQLQSSLVRQCFQESA